MATVVDDLRHKHNSNMVECNTSPEAESKERAATKMESEISEKHAGKRPSEIDFNDDDLLITVIVKNRDMGSCHESASWSVSSKAKLRMLKSPKKGSRLLIQTTDGLGTGWKADGFDTKDCVVLVDSHRRHNFKRCCAVSKSKE
jgi:hypothetical protein